MKSSDSIKVVWQRLIEQTERNCLVYLNSELHMLRLPKDVKTKNLKRFRALAQTVDAIEINFAESGDKLLLGIADAYDDACLAGIYFIVQLYPDDTVQ